MRQPWRDQFPLAPGIVMLNHASYGLAPDAMLEHCAALRRDLERDPNTTLGEVLDARLRSVVDLVATELGLSASFCALTTSATSGAAAVQRSVPLGNRDTVVVLDCEYSSVIRGWQRRCEEVGATLRVVPVPLPFTDADELLTRMSCVAGDSVTVLQFSAVTSSAALRLPIAALADWGRRHGATVVVDAAHAPFHVEIGTWHGVDIAFGTLHKWLPVPRSVGLLWGGAAAARLRPAETSLSVDATTLADRFGWPGTFDPASRLAVPEAIALHREWTAAGAINNCEHLAEYAVGALSEIGAVPTASEDFRSPRLRAFLLPHTAVEDVRQALLDDGIRAWTGRHGESASIIRLATHVYNDRADIDALVRTVGRCLRG